METYSNKVIILLLTAIGCSHGYFFNNFASANNNNPNQDNYFVENFFREINIPNDENCFNNMPKTQISSENNMPDFKNDDSLGYDEIKEDIKPEDGNYIDTTPIKKEAIKFNEAEFVNNFQQLISEKNPNTKFDLLKTFFNNYNEKIKLKNLDLKVINDSEKDKSLFKINITLSMDQKTQQKCTKKFQPLIEEEFKPKISIEDLQREIYHEENTKNEEEIIKNFGNLRKQYRLNIKNLVIIYDNTEGNFEYEIFKNFFNYRFPLVVIGFSKEECNGKNYVKILIHLNKLIIRDAKRDFDVKHDGVALKPIKILFVDGAKYNFTSFIGKSSDSCTQFYKVVNRELVNISENEFKNLIIGKKNSKFFNNTTHVRVSDLLEEQFIVMKRQYSKIGNK